MTFGIRPEHLQLSPAGEGTKAEIAAVEPTGSETHVVVRAGGDRLTAVFRERIGAAPGDTLRLAPQPGSGHLFDTASGRRI